MEERELLVKRVFPALNRRARDRGVELIDVDLRWGVTEEQTKQGLTLPLCLGEIDRCRPYFIGLLGERHGWVPPADFYKPELLERQPWLRQHQGGASVTELEILHGVLNDPKMAGRAFFYFRDPAWSQAQSEPGFVCDTPEEEAKLAALKRKILASDFPVKQGLPDPKSIADQIEADLWTLIEDQYPDLDQADALEREERKHASYRQSRLGVYLGQDHVDQLEALIGSGERKILITGESGSGKSALIANWMHQHELENPGDVVYAHHLGCSNDANAIQAFLSRMLDTASKLLKDAELITEPIQVPQDWWELTAKVAETLQDLGRWCRKTGHRWIWVLDGLDRLDAEDQQALPWLPLLIPEGVSVVISSLDCQARGIVQKRQFQLLEIGPLKREEQEQLIESYLERYTKKLDADRLTQILACELARSPLFLRVLLEELRQCGRFETLEAQIADYIRPTADGSLAVNDLYARVLARLESDCGAEPVRKALTALWASRAGLSEPELLAITGLAPLQWAPIDLGLEKAFGRNGNRLVLDHDYIRHAVEDRYLYTDELREHAHSQLADCFGGFRNKAGKECFWRLFGLEKTLLRLDEETPWQLSKSRRGNKLKSWLMSNMLRIAKARGWQELNSYLASASIDPLEFVSSVRERALVVIKGLASLEKRPSLVDDDCYELGLIADLLEDNYFRGQLLLQIRNIALASRDSKHQRKKDNFKWNKPEAEALARALMYVGDYKRAKTLMHCRSVKNWLLMGRIHLLSGDPCKADYCFRRWGRSCGVEPNGKLQTPAQLILATELGSVQLELGNYDQAEATWISCLLASEDLFGLDHHNALAIVSNLGALYGCKGDYEQAEAHYTRCLKARERLLGPKHKATNVSRLNLADLLSDQQRYSEAIELRRAELAWCQANEDLDAKDKLISMHGLGCDLLAAGETEQALEVLLSCLNGRQQELGACDGDTLSALARVLDVLSLLGRQQEALVLSKEAQVNLTSELGENCPEVFTQLSNQASLQEELGELEQAESLYRRALYGREAVLGTVHPYTLSVVYNLAEVLSQLERRDEAVPLRRRELAYARQQNGDTDPGTLTSINGLAIDLRESGALEEAEALFRELMEGRQQVLEPSDFGIGLALGDLAKTLEEAGNLEEALTYSQQALDHRLAHEGPDAWWTNRERLDLARVLGKLGRDSEAFAQVRELQQSMGRNDNPNDDDRELIIEAAELLRVTYGGKTPEA